MYLVMLIYIIDTVWEPKVDETPLFRGYCQNIVFYNTKSQKPFFTKKWKVDGIDLKNVNSIYMFVLSSEKQFLNRTISFESKFWENIKYFFAIQYYNISHLRLHWILINWIIISMMSTWLLCRNLHFYNNFRYYKLFAGKKV